MSTSAPVLDPGAGRSPQDGVIRPLERRRNKRFNITLLGRFMRENKEEYPCKLRDISVGGAAIISPVELSQGERIVGYFDHIGGIEGIVVRSFEGGFAIELTVTQHKREKLATQLNWLSNRGAGAEPPKRRHERFAADNHTANLRLDEGISVPVRVIDVSISGASVATEARPAIGSEVVLGKLRARVVRQHADGLGLEFIDIQNPDALRRYFG